MPRPNLARALGSERALARRIQQERQARDWSHELLARKMTAAGCQINQSAIWKVENGDPPRRITVDELVALSRVFDIPIEKLLLPPELVADARARAIVERFAVAVLDLEKAISAARTERDAAQAELVAALADDDLAKRIIQVFTDLAEEPGSESHVALEQALTELRKRAKRAPSKGAQ